MREDLSVVQSPALVKLIDELRRWRRPLTCDELSAVVERHPLTRQDLEEFIHFRETVYFHQPIIKERLFEVGCIGWRAGHASPIHDHLGSACCVRVIEGVLTNTDYTESVSEQLEVCNVTHLLPGELLVRSDRQPHRVSNDSPAGQLLISLHVYSPPLLPLGKRVREGPGTRGVRTQLEER